MQIKGTAVRVTPEYIKNHHADKYDEWMNSLPSECQVIMNNPIIATEWYDVNNAVLIPTKIIADMFFNGKEVEAALELGKYSAEVALKGVYKIFVMISTPAFLISRATSIFSTYYRPADIKIVESTKDSAVFEFKHITEAESLIAWRIAGWMVHALDIVKKKDMQMDIKSDFTPGNEIVTITMTWQ